VRKKRRLDFIYYYQSVLLDMMAVCAYMNSETLFFECFWECFFHTFCIYDNGATKPLPTENDFKLKLMYKWRNLNNKRHEIYSYFIMETIQK
jgi:hypothetical protein